MWTEKQMVWEVKPYGRIAQDPTDKNTIFIELFSGMSTGLSVNVMRDHTKEETVEVLGYPNERLLDLEDPTPLLYFGKTKDGSDIIKQYGVKDVFESVQENGDGCLHILKNNSDRTLILRITTGKELKDLKRQ
jgi:hypothetical protein